MSRKSIPFILTVGVVFVLFLINNAVRAADVNYIWTGDAGDGKWSTSDNWEPAGPPPHNSGAISAVFSEDIQMIPITIPAGFTADCTFGDQYGTIYGPAFGMHLDIYGSLTYKWYLAAGQTNPAGQRSVINMFSGSSIYGAEGIAIGDNWWLPGPYVTMNMFGSASADINWLWVGGHLNMYGGTMNIKQGINMSVNVNDALTRVDIYAGKLILPVDVNEATIRNWISRGILLAYGRKPGTEGCDIIIDTKTTPGRITLTATAGSSAMSELYYNEKPNEADLWAKMERAVSTIEFGKDSDVEAIKNNLLTNFKSNPRLPEVLIYIADMYESSRKYDKAKALFQQIIQQFPQSPRAKEVPFALERLKVLALIESGNKDALSAVDSFTAAFSSRSDLPLVLSNSIAERLYEKAFMDVNSEGLRQPYLQKAIGIWEKISSQSPACTADCYYWAGHSYYELGQYTKAIECYQKVVDDFPTYSHITNALFRMGRCYESMKRSGTITQAEADVKIKEVYQKLVENYPDSNDAMIAESWLEENK